MIEFFFMHAYWSFFSPVMLATFIYNTFMDWIDTWFKIIWLYVVKSEFVYFLFGIFYFVPLICLSFYPYRGLSYYMC